jgi:hypothetical protein
MNVIPYILLGIGTGLAGDTLIQTIGFGCMGGAILLAIEWKR